jgi:hypothetical protein
VPNDEAPRPVPAAFITDASAPTGRRFECTACGWSECCRVLVKRPTGEHYTTEFVACSACQVVYHWAGDVPRPGQRGAPTAGLPGAYMAGLGGQHDSGMSEEQLQVIQEAADRARKGRSWRARRR